MTLLRVEFLLLVLTAALPWEGALGYPSEAVSVVKILGVLLFMAWLLRAMARSEPLRVSPALAWAGFFLFAVLLSTLFAPDPADSVFDALRYAAVRRVLLPRAAAHPHDRGRPQGGAGLRAVVHPGRRLGPLRLHRAQPRTRGGADRGPQRLRLPDGLRIAAGVLPARGGEAPADRVGHLLPAADRRHVRDAFAGCIDRPRGPRAVGRAVAPHPAQRRGARARRGAQRRGARLRTVGAAAQRSPLDEGPHRGQERGRARGAMDGRGADGRRPAVHRRRAGPLRHRVTALRAQQPDPARRDPGRPQLLPARAG